jgi:hypothetical protein
VIFVSLLAVVTLALFARALGFAAAPVIDADTAHAEVAAALPGFVPGEVALDAAGRGALIEACDGRLALVRPHGDRWVVRQLDHAAAELAAPYLTLRLREPMFAPTTLDLGAGAARWAAKFDGLATGASAQLAVHTSLREV